MTYALFVGVFVVGGLAGFVIGVATILGYMVTAFDRSLGR